MDWTSSAPSRGQPVHSVGLQDQQDKPGRQANLTQRDTTAVNDLCSARLVPGFSATVTFEGVSGGVQFATYRVSAVGTGSSEGFLYVCSKVITDPPHTHKIFISSTQAVMCSHMKRGLLLSLVYGQCAGIYHEGITLDYSLSTVLQPGTELTSLNSSALQSGPHAIACSGCLFVTALSGVYEPGFQVHYSTINQGNTRNNTYFK